jgi:hypothetical protein
MDGLTLIKIDVRSQGVDAFLTKYPGIITANLMRSMEDCKQPAHDTIYEAIVGKLIRVRANKPVTKKRKGHGVPLVESGEYASSWRGHITRKVGTKKDVITLTLAPEGTVGKSRLESRRVLFEKGSVYRPGLGISKKDRVSNRNKRKFGGVKQYNYDIPMEYLGLLLENGTRRVKAMPHVGKLEAYLKPRMLNIIQKNLDELIK